MLRVPRRLATGHQSGPHRRTTPRRAGKFTPEQVTQILAVACEPPEKSGRPITHWTAQELTEEVVRRGSVASISPSPVSRYRREAALQPHKSRSWLNTTGEGSRAV